MGQPQGPGWARNVFQGGFLGLDNIGVFDRSAPLPEGGHLGQADGTAWMGFYSLQMMAIALELARENPVYEDVATKFFEHFLYIAAALNDIGGTGVALWDDEDGFFYDVLHLPDDSKIQLKVRSLVGLIPLLAVETIEPEMLERFPGFARRLGWFLRNRPDLAALVSHWDEPGVGERRLIALVRGHRMKLLLRRMLDPDEFLSPHGIRSLSRFHLAHPYDLDIGGQSYDVDYEPAESTTGFFGGNSNWRGPVWFPLNYLLIEALQKFHRFYGDDFLVESPTGSGEKRSLEAIADDLAERLVSIFARDGDGRRPVFGADERSQTDPNWRDRILFYEYFHGDTGAGPRGQPPDRLDGARRQAHRPALARLRIVRRPTSAASSPRLWLAAGAGPRRVDRQIVVALPSIDRRGERPADDEDADDGEADQSEIETAHEVPDPAGQAEPFGEDVEDLDPADRERDDHRHKRDVQVVVQLPDRLDVGPAIGAEHQDPVRRIDQRHARREECREDEDEHDRDVVGAGGRRETQEGDLARGVEPESEQDPERVHVPALADEAKHRLEEPREEPAVVEELLEGLLVIGAAGRDAPEHPVDVDEHDQVDEPDDQEEDGRDRGPDETADLLHGGDVADHPGRDGDEHRQPDDDGGWPSEKNSPTATGRCPSCMSFRVVLSIAAM